MAKEINYEDAYRVMLAVHRLKLGYSIERLAEYDGFDGCLLTGDHFYLRDFAGLVKKYGYETVEKVVNDIIQGDKG